MELFPPKLNAESPGDPAVLPQVRSREAQKHVSTQDAHTDVHGSVARDSQEVGTAPVFVDKGSEVRPRGASFSHSRNEGADGWVGLENIRLTARSHPPCDPVYTQCAMSVTGRARDRGGRGAAAGPERRGAGERLPMAMLFGGWGAGNGNAPEVIMGDEKS